MKWLAILAMFLVPFAASGVTKAPKPIGEIKVQFKDGETQELRVTNKGTKPFTIRSIKASEGTTKEFFDAGSTCIIGKTVAPTESCSFKYSFKKADKGSRMLTLKVDATTEDYVIRMRGVGSK